MPRPKEGEDKEAYVSRFMASAEAQRDYPDQKQRAAVAYSMWGEKGNNMQICPECGCEMTMLPDAVMSECAACGRQQHGKPTPPVEDLNNICPHCHHPIAPEHDDYGCHIAGCGCAETAAALADPRAMLPNAEKKNAGDVEAIKHQIAEWKKRAANPDLTQEERDQARTMQGNLQDQLDAAEKQNVEESEWKEKSDYNPDGGCKKCGWGAPGSGHSSGYHKEDCKVLQKERDKFDHLQGMERRNAMDAFDAHAKACAGCTNAYNAGKAEMMCAEGAKLVNGKAEDAAQIERLAEGIEHEAGEIEAENAKKCPVCSGRGYGGNGDRCAECGGSGKTNSVQNADVQAQGGEEAGKPGGTVTVVNAGEGPARVKFAEARAAYAKQLAEHQKTLALAKKSGEPRLVEQAEALVHEVEDRIAMIDRQNLTMENALVLEDDLEAAGAAAWGARR